MRVVIADDSLIVRSGVARLLEMGGFTVEARAGDGAELLASIGADPPDVALLDIRMPPTFTDEGLLVASELRERYPRIGLLLLSTYAESEYATALLRIGRSGVGYLLKSRIEDVESLCDAVRRVAAGQYVVDPDVVARLLDRESARSLLGGLRPRETEVLRLMAEGRSNAGIGRLLHLQQTTIEKHVAAVFTALRLPRESDDNRRVAAVLVWLQAAAREAS